MARPAAKNINVSIFKKMEFIELKYRTIKVNIELI
jgi:hypothetical protein